MGFRGREIEKLLLCLIFTFLAITEGQAQSQNHPTIITTGVVVDGDTLPLVHLQEINCWARRRFKNRRSQERYTRLVRNVRKTLPYARIAAERLTLIEDSLSKISSAKAKEAYLKAAEKQLFNEFEKPLKHLSVSQGRILIKLIDRETGNTSYELIKALRGRFSAFLWQGVARLFGSSLKSEYDPKKDDKAIEQIVNAIDAGAYDDIPL